MVNKFVVTPMIQRISLKAGETYEGTITVANPAAATEDFYFKATLSPYSVVGTDYSPDFKTESDWSRIVKWITLDTTGGKLAPNETKKINFKIEVPEDAPAGGQYAMIGISSNGEVTSNGGAVQDIYEMASLIYAQIEGETKHGGEIKENIIPGFVTSGKPATTISLSNDGNVHEIATTKVSVKNVLNGQMVMSGDNESDSYESIIMPESIRTFSRVLDNVPELGIFEVKQDIEYLGNTSSITTIMVVCPIWFMALVAGVFISVVGMICYGKHLKNKKKKQLHFENTNAKIDS